MPVPYTGKKQRYIKCFRQVKTYQERRISCDKEIKQYVRAARNIHDLPSDFDDIRRNFTRCWKRQYKLKHQWMIHQK